MTDLESFQETLFLSDKAKPEDAANFLLHPKRLSSDSEGSAPNTPTKFCSSTGIGKFRETYLTNTSFTKTLIMSENQPKTSKEARQEKTKTKMNTARSSTRRFEDFDKKFKMFVEKSIKLLSDIRLLFENGIPQPDGEEDTIRRTKRVQEFSARFSRTYFYPLLRQMDELSIPERIPFSLINQKLLYAQQVILQGLQAYYNHLPTSVGKCCSDKLQSLLEQILYLCQLFGLLKKYPPNESNEFINALRNHTELLIETIKTFDFKFVEKPLKMQKTPKKKQHNIISHSKSKLSMYASSTSFRKDLEWKRAVESLANRKFNVKSRYKTANFKHRPPIEKLQISETPTKVKQFSKSRLLSGTLQETPEKSSIREDEIKTMVEIESGVEAPPNSGKIVNHRRFEETLVRDSRIGSENCDDDDDGGVKNALKILKKFLTRNGKGNDREVLEQLENVMGEVKDQNKKMYKEPIVTITGERNAKLICIRDDYTIEDSSDKEEKDDKDEQLYKENKEIMTEPKIKLSSSETQTDFKEIPKHNKSTIKISRLPKNKKKMLQLLPKDYAVNIIQYKLRLTHFHKDNPMYRRCSNVQPWVLMGKVSDLLLDDLLQSVAGELEVHEMVDNLYNSEFQY